MTQPSLAQEVEAHVHAVGKLVQAPDLQHPSGENVLVILAASSAQEKGKRRFWAPFLSFWAKS